MMSMSLHLASLCFACVALVSTLPSRTTRTTILSALIMALVMADMTFSTAAGSSLLRVAALFATLVAEGLALRRTTRTGSGGSRHIPHYAIHQASTGTMILVDLAALLARPALPPDVGAVPADTSHHVAVWDSGSSPLLGVLLMAAVVLAATSLLLVITDVRRVPKRGAIQVRSACMAAMAICMIASALI